MSFNINDINKDILKDVQKKLEPIVMDFVNATTADLSDAAKHYGKDIAADFAVTLWMSRHGDNEMAKRNLLHLKTQVKQLAMTRSLNLNKNIMIALEKGLEVAWRIGLKMLLA